MQHTQSTAETVQALRREHPFLKKIYRLITLTKEVGLSSPEPFSSPLTECWEGLPEYLKDVRESPEETASLASRSFLHANEFTKIVLWRGISCTVRLHIRWPTHDEPKDGIHDHRWAQCTLVAVGELVHQVYSEVEGDTYQVSIHHGDALLGQVDVTPKIAGLALTSYNILNSGSIFTLDPSVPHRAFAAAGKPEVSLVVQGETVRPASRIFDEDIKIGELRKPTPMEPNVLLRELDRFNSEVYSLW